MVEVLLDKSLGFIEKKWDGKSRTYLETPIRRQDHLVARWYDNLLMPEQITLRDLFDAMTTLDSVETLCLLVQGDIPAMLLDGYKEQEPDDALTSLELRWMSAVDEFSGFYVSSDFHARGKPYYCGPPSESPDYSEETKHLFGDAYGVDLVPIGKLIDLPITLNEKLEVRDERGGFPYPTLLDTTRAWTVGEFVRGVFWELSFFGTPDQREQMAEELEERIEDVESGKAELIPWEDIRKDFE